MSTAKQKTSSVWAYFSKEFGTPFARCNKCSVKIKRGQDGNKKTWSSNPLWSHLKTKHGAEHIKALKERDNADQLTKKRKLDEAEKLAVYVNGTPTLEAFIEQKKKYQPDNATQKSITEGLTTWIADGVLPYETIDNERFVTF